MRITFAYPDYENLGVEILMACCTNAGHSVSFQYYECEDSYTGMNVDPDFDGLAENIIRAGCDLLALSTVTDNFKSQLALAQAVKRRAPEVKTIFGGVHVTAVPACALEHDAVDCVAMNEAEHTLIELLANSTVSDKTEFPSAPIRGLAWKSGETIVGDFTLAPNIVGIDSLPFPNKGPLYQIRPHFGHQYYIMASRGCPYACTFCFNSSTLTDGPPVRRRSQDNVIEELRIAVREHNPKTVLFLDDTFTGSKKWLIPFLEQYKTEIGLPFSCITHPSLLDEERIKVLAAAGCVNVQVGIQSLSEELCTGILKRKGTRQRAADTLVLLKKYGISAQVDHMLGIPGDTLEYQEDAIRFFNVHRPETISIFWLTYYPGTAIIEEAKNRGILKSEDVSALKSGNRLKRNSYLSGGDCEDWVSFLGASVVLNWLPLLPRPLVEWLVRSGHYKRLTIRSFLFSTALPRVIRSLTDRRDVRGRSHLVRALTRMVKKFVWWKKTADDKDNWLVQVED